MEFEKWKKFKRSGAYRNKIKQKYTKSQIKLLTTTIKNDGASKSVDGSVEKQEDSSSEDFELADSNLNSSSVDSDESECETDVSCEFVAVSAPEEFGMQ